MGDKPEHIKAADFTAELVRRDPYAPAKNSYTDASSSVRGETWIENPWGWVFFFGVIGAVMIGFPTKHPVGFAVGAVVFGGAPWLASAIVGGRRVFPRLPRLRGLGAWPAWTIVGAGIGVLAGFGLAAAVDALDAPLAELWRGVVIVAAGFAALATVLRLVLGLFVKPRKAVAPSDVPRRER
jgi:hypothetical protein